MLLTDIHDADDERLDSLLKKLEEKAPDVNIDDIDEDSKNLEIADDISVTSTSTGSMPVTVKDKSRARSTDGVKQRKTVTSARSALKRQTAPRKDDITPASQRIAAVESPEDELMRVQAGIRALELRLLQAAHEEIQGESDS